jgi:thioesterase domain-containing protein
VSRSRTDLEALTPEQRELYERLLKRRSESAGEAEEPGGPDGLGPAVDGTVTGETLERRSSPPLSFSQHRLWFFNRLAPGSAAYNIALLFRLRGPLDVEALQRSFDEIVRRHEITRTRCVRSGASMIQEIDPPTQVEMDVVDLRSVDESGRESEAIDRAREAGKRPFDLEGDLLVRTGLYRLDDDHALLLFVTHHFVSDGWAMRIWMRELAALYNELRAGQPSPLPELPIQYSEYARWQREQVRGEFRDRLVSFWRKRLKDAPKMLPLPTDHRRTYKPVAPSEIAAVSLSPEVSSRLHELARESEVTLFTVLLAAFQAELGLLADRDEVVVGVPISTRTRIDTEDLLGNFANYVLFHTDLSGNPPFREAVSRVRKVAAEAYGNLELPLEELAEHLQETGEVHLLPQLQVLFVLREGHYNELLELTDLDVESLAIDLGETRVELYLDLVAGVDQIRGKLIYRTDLFEEATARSMVERFEKLLETVVSDPDTRLSELFIEREPGRSAVAEPDREGEPALPRFRRPEAEPEFLLRGIWERIFDYAPIGLDDNFFAIGGTSVLAIGVYAEIERRTGIQVPAEALIVAPTIAGLADLLRELGWTPRWTHLVQLQPSSADKPPLFCVHSLGGHAMLYSQLGFHLGRHRPVYGLKAANLKELGEETYEELALRYVAEIVDAEPEGPYHIAGHCTGSVLALAIAHQLESQGRDVGCLLALEGFLISRPRDGRWTQLMSAFEEIGLFDKVVGEEEREARRRRGEYVMGGASTERIHTMDVIDEMRTRYSYPTLSGRVHVFLTDSSSREKHDPVPTWREIATGGVEVIDLTGKGHDEMMFEPHAGSLAERVEQVLVEFETARVSG